jgi:hypothetical protein
MAQAIPVQANVRPANLKARSAGRSQHRQHVQKALIDCLYLGRLES